MLTIGLTGGIGSGKTAVSDTFAKLGVSIFDADIAAREIVEPGKPALREIQQHFGDEVINNDGSLDRAALRAIVFNNPDQRKWLEQLTHPLIREHLVNQLSEAVGPYNMLVSPLLLETDQHTIVDRVLVVDVPEQLQLERAAARDNNDEAQIRRIMASQSDRQSRRARADDIIVNDGSLEDLQSKVETLHQRYLSISQNEQA